MARLLTVACSCFPQDGSGGLADDEEDLDELKLRLLALASAAENHFQVRHVTSRRRSRNVSAFVFVLTSRCDVASAR